MRGGKREGAGRKPRLKRYKWKNLPEEKRQQSTFSRRAVVVGQRCETLWREAHSDCWKGEKRTSRHKKIHRQVASEFNKMRLTPRMVERLWKDYRRLEADLRADAEAEQPV